MNFSESKSSIPDPATSLVSVVIPTYNRAYCIGTTIDSVLAQTYSNVQVVVVDDGSTDGTAELIADRYGSDRRVCYHYQANAGVCAARNRGFDLADGDYIALLDSDDVWQPWKVELQIGCFRHSHALGMVWTDMAAINVEGAVFSKAYLRQMYSAYQWFRTEELFSAAYAINEVVPSLTSVLSGAKLHTGQIFSQMVMGNLVHTSTVMLSRERLRLVRQFDEELAPAGEDYDFHLRTCREGLVGFVDVPGILYQRGRPDQLSRYRMHVARNFLRTVSRVIEHDRERIHLPQHMIDHVLAEAYQWVGSELVNEGRNSEARAHLMHSLRHRFDSQTLRWLAMSALPNAVRPHLRLALQQFRRIRKPQTV